MTRIALYGNKRPDADHSHLQQLVDILASLYPHVTCSMDLRYMYFLRSNIRLPEVIRDTFTEADPTADLVLSIGGGGTFLKTANRVGILGTPIMGINSGHLGYLAAADISEAPDIIHDILAGDYRIEHRSVIEVSGPDSFLPERPFALNEVAILKKDTASMITVDASIDGGPTVTYRADGLIVSTPTGSTGYNLSAGGPIVAPTCGCWTVAPVAPHSLNMRPLVVPDTTVIDLKAHSRAETFLLSIDGKSTPLPAGCSLRLRKASYTVNTVLRSTSNIIDTLRQKLLWGRDGI